MFLPGVSGGLNDVKHLAQCLVNSTHEMLVSIIRSKPASLLSPPLLLQQLPKNRLSTNDRKGHLESVTGRVSTTNSRSDEACFPGVAWVHFKGQDGRRAGAWHR